MKILLKKSVRIEKNSLGPGAFQLKRTDSCKLKNDPGTSHFTADARAQIFINAVESALTKKKKLHGV